MSSESSSSALADQWRAPGSNDNIVARMERVPFTRWQVKARLLVGTGTFFDAFDALAISQVTPVIGPLWHLSSGELAMLISIGYLGQLFGALLFPTLAERYGRLKALSAAITVFAVFGLGCALSTGYGMFMVFRFLQGMGLGGEVPIGAVYINEITKAKGRGRFVLLFELIFSVGVVVSALVGRWVVPNLGWHVMYIIGMLPILFVPIILRYLPESPRWLAQRGQTADADRAMTRMEQGVTAYTGEVLPEPKASVHRITEKKGSFRELFSPMYRTRTITVWVIWFATYLVYYGLGTWLPSLYHNHFHLSLDKALTYGLIGNVCAFIGAALCAFTIDHLGRKRVFVWSLVLTCLMLVILALTGAHTANQLLVWGSLAWLFAGANSIGLYVYTPEIYPTRIRSIGVGTATAWMRFASMLGPILIGTLMVNGLPLTFIVFAVVAGISAVVVRIWAIETSQRVLEEVSP